VTFVWFDALVNYISFAPGYDPRAASRDPEFQALWPAVHVIGKDILIPAHGVYWPIMLKALGFADGEMPTLLVHGWWNIAGSKMSKTIGNIVDPGALADWVRGQVEKGQARALRRRGRRNLRPMRRRDGPLLSHERHHDRARRRFFRDASLRAVQHRSRQRIGQLDEPHSQHGEPLP
jgi:valyl-tRNA synthetase